jgi:hypothetical protein
MHGINVDLTKSVKKMLAPVPDNDMSEIMAAYMSILAQPEHDEDVPVDPKTLQQMALLACVTLSRVIMERHK